MRRICWILAVGGATLVLAIVALLIQQGGAARTPGRSGLSLRIPTLPFRRADADETTPNTTALMVAVDDGDVAAARRSLERGVPVNARDEMGATALISAAEMQSFEMVQLLLSHRADVNAISNSGVSALVCAAGTLRLDIVRALLDAGADPDAKDQRGNTPLTISIAAGGAPELVKLLLDYGADPNLKGTDDRTPLRHAERRESAEIERLLREAGAKGP
jgi:ankyrin repeat protein